MYSFTTLINGFWRTSHQQRDHSMLTWESTQLQGTASIVEKLTVRPLHTPTLSNCLPGSAQPPQRRFLQRQTLPFAKVVHKVSTLDAQPSSTTSAALVVLVTGPLIVSPTSDILGYANVP